MKRIAFVCALLFVATRALCQFTPYGLGVVQQPNAQSERAYIGVSNVWDALVAGANITFSVSSRKLVISSTGGGTNVAGVTNFSAGNLSPLFTTSVANPTNDPALSFAQVSQSANRAFIGPASGGAAAPTFRLLVPADLGAFTNHSDVIPISLAAGQSLVWSGTAWTNGVITSVPVIPDPLTNHTYATNLFGVISNTTAGAFTNHNDVTPISLSPGNILAWSGNAWTNGNPGSGTTTINLTNAGNATGSLINDSNQPTFKLKSLSAGANVTLTDEGTNIVIAAASSSGGSSTNFDVNFFDDNVYEVDEEFDQWRGTGSGQFTRGSGWAVTTVGGGGGVNNVNSNVPPYYGLIEIQGSTTPSNAVFVSQSSGSGIAIYQNLATATNWLFHGTFFLHVTNIGSIYRFGLADGINSAVGPALFPSNSLGLRWYKNLNDGNKFIFEARSNATSVSVASTITVAIDTAYKFNMWCQTNGIVWFSINGETPVSLTNTPNQSLSMNAFVSLTNATAGRMWLDRMSFRATQLGR